jgi:7,8-dihydropterin-6-yl-methyl-4-(beta-D-ribofuranosyl)aminobenzene 5'-phosphate synthase
MKTNSPRITILVDNQAASGLAAEHGLSVWIEWVGKRILFDTGQSGVLDSNARLLGVDLTETEVLVLSHGHYDHTGGISQALRHNQRVNVFCHPEAMQQPRYGIRNGTAKPIHMPDESRTAIENLPAQNLHWVSQPVWLSDKIGITGAIPRETIYEDTGGPFYLDPEGKSPDPIEDDLALWICTDDGLIVCVGCCHAGLVNTLHYLCRLTRQDKIYVVIGGFHLLNASDQRLKLTLGALQSFSPSMVIPCHCTGEKATNMLKAVFGGRVMPGYAGATFELSIHY